ncbi:hypothetical protein EV643_11532 [Kribbella sp. VKM Ac-2527]|uniref:Uncharacterized protein n=1 Tax=Kribbella caucasensis TaxID=2512215 RepID=A0A4R6K834_9ACTN|nr:hypothetical protein EV643_11532 [Kribbella sp. VKM Ac-2527]
MPWPGSVQLGRHVHVGRQLAAASIARLAAVRCVERAAVAVAAVVVVGAW